jgi:hypothetical protein
MHLLTPTDEYLKIYPYAPLYILFGDKHKDSTGFCTDPIIEKGDYTIYDPNFLQLFNDALNKKEGEKENGTIDFYVEGGVYGDLHQTDKNFKDQAYPLKKIINLFVDCYNNTRMPDRKRIIKDERKLTCSKLNNIRWQSGDIRFSMKSKGNITMLLYDLETNTQTKLRESFIQNLKSKILERGQKYTDGLSTAPFNVKEYIVKYLKTDNLITKQLNKIKDTNVKDTIISKFEIYIKNVHSNLFKGIKANYKNYILNLKMLALNYIAKNLIYQFLTFGKIRTCYLLMIKL